MGRPRKSKSNALPKHVYANRGWWFYRVPDTGKWIKLAKIGESAEMYRVLADILAGSTAGTMQQIFDRYKTEVLAKKKGRTRSEQERQLPRLETAFGAAPQGSMLPQHVGRYLATRGAVAPVVANREIALLSHVFSVAIGKWYMPLTNPCLGVERNDESPRRHKITDAELMTAWTAAKPWMRAAMVLAYVCGQRVADVRKLCDTDFNHFGLSLKQNKTGTDLDLQWTPNLRAARDYCLSVRKTTPMDRSLIVLPSGRRPTHTTWYREWDRIQKEVEKAGGRRFQFRDIRPRSATDHATGKHLGHLDPRVLERVYRLGARKERPL